MHAGTVDVGSKGRTTGGKVPAGKFGSAPDGQRIHLRRVHPFGSKPCRLVIPDDAGPDDEHDSCRLIFGCLPRPTFEAVGDILFNPFGRHAG